jgi:hypothetical protein
MFIIWNPLWPEPPTKVLSTLRQAVRIQNSMQKKSPGDYRILEVVPPKIVFVIQERINEAQAELDEEGD